MKVAMNNDVQAHGDRRNLAGGDHAVEHDGFHGQSRRLQSVGLLAAGVAHEFNNLLQSIQGYATSAKEQLDPECPARGDLQRALAAARKAAAITSSLLSFARRQPSERRLTPINTLVADVMEMVRPLFGEGLEISTSLGEGAGSVLADGALLEQMLVNLCTNARDAIAGPGRLSIATDGTHFEDESAIPNLRAGRYVVITVSDTGCGMSAGVQRRIFEPFFTTKPAGRGTGLGLALVAQTVEEHEGAVTVESRPQQGTTVRVYLPRAADEATLPPPREHGHEGAAGPGHGSRRVPIEGTGESEQARAMLNHRLESVGQLASGVAHEINTPAQYVGDNLRFLRNSFGDLLKTLDAFQELRVAAVRGEVDDLWLARLGQIADNEGLGYLTSEIPQALDESLEGMNRIASIVRAMKEFSHPGSDEHVPIDLEDALKTTLTVARNEWKYVARVETDFDESLPKIPGLPGELNQVFLNLIVNAAHAIKDLVGEGSREKGKITISTRRLPGAAEIRIADSGAGIPECVQSRIFDPYFTTKGVGEGTGQGLAIARSVVVDKHGGTIDFETAPGRGTTFRILLPLADTEAMEGADP